MKSFLIVSFLTGYCIFPTIICLLCFVLLFFFIIFIIISGIITGIITANDDPCSIAKRLPSLELRLKAYKINPNRDTALCDRYLINHPGEWFRSEDGNEMVNNATERNECGTDYGIYMIGKISRVYNLFNNHQCYLP